MKTGYFRDLSGNPVANTNYTRYIINDEGKTLQDVLDSLAYTSDIERVADIKNLPVIGTENHLYIDIEKGGIYLWSNIDSSYIRVNAVDSGIIENTHIHANMETLNAIKYALTEELKQYYDSAVQDIYIGDVKQTKNGNEIHIPAIEGAASSIIKSNLQFHKVLVSNDEGKVGESNVSVDELNNLMGLTKNIETEFSDIERDITNETNRATMQEQNIATNLGMEINRAVSEESDIVQKLTTETIRAKDSEKTLSDNLSTEVSRAFAQENELQGNIDAHTAAVDGELQALKAADTALDEKKADLSYTNEELGKRYTTDQVYTREEILLKIKDLIGTAPETLDTFKEIADALGNDPNFAATIMNALAGKVDKVSGKGLSTNDYSASEKAVVADVNARKHDHSNKTIIDKLTQALVDTWNTVSNKVDKVTGKGLSSNDYTTDEKNKLAGISPGAEVNIQSDWTVTDTASDAYIKGKPTSMPASDVSAWAKAAAKPAYGWAEITGKPASFAPSSHTHAKSQITDMPTKLSQFDNDPGYITQADVDTSQSHTHANKTILDKITQTLLDNWNAAISTTALTNGSLDDKKTPGLYFAGGDNIVTGKPDKVDAFGLTIYKTAVGFVTQELTEGSASPGKKYIRQNNGTVWSEWVPLPTYTSAPVSGQVIVSDGITGGQKTSGFTIAASVPAGAKFTDTVYTHPSYTAKTAGLYKVTVDASGHVSAAASVAKADITGLGIPAQDTTYGVATTSANGLMAAADKSKLDGVATGANNYAHPNSGATAGTYRSITINAQGHVTGGTNPTTVAGYGITDAAAKDTFIKNITLAPSNFSNLTATVTNSAIKESHIATAIFSEATRDIAVKANIYVKTNNGSISFVAKKLPTQNIVVDVIQLTDTV